jgi:hypothetical protein
LDLRDEVTEDRRKLHKEQFHDLYTSPNIIRMIKSKTKGWAGHVVRIGEMINVYKIVAGKPEGRRPV